MSFLVCLSPSDVGWISFSVAFLGKRVELAGVPAAGGSAAKLQQPLSENMTAARDSPPTRG